MKTYAELGAVYRCDPCVEYPGTWLVFVEGDEPISFAMKADAVANCYKQAETREHVRLCWQASDNDPRIGQVWFTSFYRDCSF